MSAPLPAYVVREIAVATRHDPRTVVRVLRGERTKDMVRDPIVAECARRGIAVPVRAHAATD